MNILVDCKNLAQFSGGISAFFKPLLKSAIEHFYDYNFILLAPNEFDTNFIKKYKNWEIKIVPPKKTGFSSLDIIVYDLWTYPNAIKKTDARLLISPYYDFFLPQKFNGKSIITVHDLCFWDLKKIYSKKVVYYHKFLLNFNIKKAKKIITVSQTSLNRLKQVFGKKIYDKSVVVYNTFEFSKKGSLNFIKLESFQKVLLYTGGFEKRKNIDMLFRALSELKVEINIKLFFTGNFKENQQLQEMIEKYALQDVIELTGIVSNEKLQEYYKKCDTVINISLSEGFGRSNLEAMMNNKPLVCSDIEVFRELIGDYPYYCDPANLESIKEAIKLSFQKKKELAYNIDFSRFGFETNKKKFIEIIENVLNEK